MTEQMVEDYLRAKISKLSLYCTTELCENKLSQLKKKKGNKIRSYSLINADSKF